LINATDNSITVAKITIETENGNEGLSGSIGKIVLDKPLSLDTKKRKFTFIKVGYNTFVGDVYFKLKRLKITIRGYAGGVSAVAELGKSGFIGFYIGIDAGVKWDWE